ncbi:hypothetical protein H8356DRAFT_1718874 [Neocallimastix lanati (nom. inval.)]|jgi:hypothetical protein|nr:hypothetical protein H8356DRAFT_1718874 [Neocallimastix sp. JGI-2020a]
MKFITQLLTILTASTVYSLELFKRDFNAGPECQKQIDTVKEFKCIGEQITLDNYKEVCPYVLSEDCSKFFENPFSYIPNCKGENDFKALEDKKTLNFSKQLKYLDCSTDGDGNLCPVGKDHIQGLQINEYNVGATCKSKKCSIVLNDALTAIVDQTNSQYSEGINGEGFVEVFTILKELLNSATCSAAAKDDTKSTVNAFSKTDTEANSGANSIYKLGNSLLLTFAIVLAYF